MIEISTLDKQIEKIKDWIPIAGNSLLTFYRENDGAFWRNSFTKKENTKENFPTSTNRSFFALFQYLKFIKENEKDDKKIKVILRETIEKYYSRLADAPKEIRTSPDNGVNTFTDSHLLYAISLIEYLEKEIIPDPESEDKLKIDKNKVFTNAKNIADENKTKVIAARGGKVDDDEAVHHFVTYAYIRGYEKMVNKNNKHNESRELLSEIQPKITEDVLRLLGYYLAGVSSKFDVAELTFSIALLNRLDAPDIEELTSKSIEIINQEQLKDGSWATSRLVSYTKKGLLHIASYEIALTLSHLLLRHIHKNNKSISVKILPILEKIFELIKSNYVTTDNVKGWANDHTRTSNLVESWTTAVVLSFLINYYESLKYLRQILILEKYGYRLTSKITAWPDFSLTLWDNAEPDEINNYSDPTDKEALATAIKKEILEPINSSWIKKPDGNSIILTGPPGTRKTTLIKKIAKTLGWPLITISPPNFLFDGLDNFEKSAATLFDDLNKLQRAVVFFDECEEFFKTRSTKGPTESRTIGAFITAGMLPRIQQLHDNKWVIFALATNIKLDLLDDAATRRGRFDFVQYLDHPTKDAQVRYIDGKEKIQDDEIKSKVRDPKSKSDFKWVKTVVEKHNQKHSTMKIPFAILDELIKKAAGKEKPDIDEEVELVRSLIECPKPPSLAPTIEPEQQI